MRVKWRVMVTGRTWAALRSLGRDMGLTSGLAELAQGISDCYSNISR